MTLAEQLAAQAEKMRLKSEAAEKAKAEAAEKAAAEQAAKDKAAAEKAASESEPKPEPKKSIAKTDAPAFGKKAGVKEQPKGSNVSDNISNLTDGHHEATVDHAIQCSKCQEKEEGKQRRGRVGGKRLSNQLIHCI